MSLSQKFNLVLRWPSTSVPSLTKSYVDAGTIQDVFLCGSSLTAHAVMNGALMMLEGKRVGPGTDLGSNQH